MQTERSCSRSYRLSSALIVLSISRTILSFGTSSRGRITKCSHNEGCNGALHSFGVVSARLDSVPASYFSLSAGVRDIRSKATVPEKNVKSTKKQSADDNIDNSARNVRFDPSRNDKNDNYADPDDAGEKFFIAGGVTNVLKVEEGKTVDGGGKETSIPSQRPRADANRNYKNSQRQEADKSYAERKLIEIETKQIETANNKIKLQNKAEAASKWVLNSLLNIENSPNRKDLKVVEKAENQNPNGNGNKNENKYENQNESDEGGADTDTDTSGDNSVLLNSVKKNSNIIYGQEQIKKLSKSSGGIIFSKQSDGSKLEGEGITDERATSAASRDDIGMSGVDKNIKLSNDKSFDLNEVEDKKVKSDEKKGQMNNNFEKDRKDTESKELKIKYKDGASIQNIQNDALTQTLTAVVNEKSSNSYSAKPNLNVILKRSLKDSLYPINTDGTYTTKETVRPINEYNPINDFVQNSITISEKVELEKKQNRLTENNEEISERDGFVNNQTREDSSDENDADESKKAKDEEGEGEGEKKEESKGDTISDSLATEDEMMEMKMEMKNIPPTKDSTGEIIELEGRNPTSVSTVTDIPKAQDGMSISLSSSTQENIYDNGNADAKDSRGDILRVEIEKEEKVCESSVHVDSNAGYNGRDNSNGNEERSTDASLPSDTDDGYLLPPVGTTHSNSPPPHSAPPAAVPSLPLASSLASTAFSIPIIAQFAVEDSSQESNSLLKEKYVKVEEVELGSDSRISPVSPTSPSLSLPTSAEIRIQLISAAAEELGIGEDNSGSDGEIGDVRGGEKVKSLVGAGEESEAVEAEKGLASPTSEYSSFPYYTPPPPPTSTAPRCMLGSWELSESRYMDEDRSILSTSSVEVINIPSFGTVSSSLSGSKGLEWKANKNKIGPNMISDESDDDENNENQLDGREYTMSEGEGVGEEGLVLKGGFDEYAVEFNIVRGCSSTEWMKGQGRNEKVITARIIKPPKEAFEQKPTLCTYEGTLTSEEYIEGVVFSTPVTLEGERRLVGEFRMYKM